MVSRLFSVHSSLYIIVHSCRGQASTKVETNIGKIPLVLEASQLRSQGEREMRELVLACSKLLVAAKTKLTKREQRVKQTARGLATTGLYYHAELSCQIKTNGNTVK